MIQLVLPHLGLVHLEEHAGDLGRPLGLHPVHLMVECLAEEAALRGTWRNDENVLGEESRHGGEVGEGGSGGSGGGGGGGVSGGSEGSGGGGAGGTHLLMLVLLSV
jgi:uncharacterized membrane protein YgcG